MGMRTTDTHNYMDEFHKYKAEQKKHRTKEHTREDFTPMKLQEDKMLHLVLESRLGVSFGDRAWEGL